MAFLKIVGPMAGRPYVRSRLIGTVSRKVESNGSRGGWPQDLPDGVLDTGRYITHCAGINRQSIDLVVRTHSPPPIEAVHSAAEASHTKGADPQSGDVSGRPPKVRQPTQSTTELRQGDSGVLFSSSSLPVL